MGRLSSNKKLLHLFPGEALGLPVGLDQDQELLEADLPGPVLSKQRGSAAGNEDNEHFSGR